MGMLSTASAATKTRTYIHMTDYTHLVSPVAIKHSKADRKTSGNDAVLHDGLRSIRHRRAPSNLERSSEKLFASRLTTSATSASAFSTERRRSSTKRD